MKVKHFVYISSIFAHLEESSPLYSIYGISKRHSEEIITFCLKRDDIPFAILRPSQLYGKDSSFVPHHPFLYEIIEKASSGGKITLFGEKGGSANYLHIRDFTEVLNRVVRNKVEGVYDCTTNVPNNYLEIASLAYELSGNENSIEFLSDLEESGQTFEFDSAIYEKVNYFPKVSMKAAIAEILSCTHLFC